VRNPPKKNVAFGFKYGKVSASCLVCYINYIDYACKTALSSLETDTDGGRQSCLIFDEMEIIKK